MHRIHAIGAIVAAGLLAGCATTPVPTGQAQEVDRANVLSPALLARRDGLVQVVVKRDSGLSASLCRSLVYANGSPVAEIAPGEKVTFYLPPGDNMLAAIATGICAGGLVETKAVLVNGRMATFRIGYGTAGEFAIQPTAF